MTIRAATTDDYAPLMALYNDFVEEDRYSQPGNDSFEIIVSDKDYVVLVAEESSRLAGFITASSRKAIRYPYPIMQVDELYVDPAFREHGLGKKLLQGVEAAAREMGCRRIYIESAYKHEAAHGFYEHNGYPKSGYYFLKVL